MGDRHLKRSWLRLVEEPDVGEASGSVPTKVTPSLIDSTLGSIREDDLWVATACVDAIETKASLADDLVTFKHMILLGIERSSVDVEIRIESISPVVMQLLAVRKVLLKYKRMTEVWEQIYGPDAEKKMGKWVDDEFDQEDSQMDDDGGDYDAWAEVAETTPSPTPFGSTRVPLSDFIRQSPLDQAIQMASAYQPVQLASFLKSLPSLLYKEVHGHRLAIVKLLLLSAASAEVDLSLLLRTRLLPSLYEGRESGLWLECKDQEGQKPDVTDMKDVYDALCSLGLTSEDVNAEDKMLGYQSKSSESLTATSLLAFYRESITSLESKSGSISAAIQLASIASSDQLHLPPDEGITRLAEDLRLLMPLNYGSASSSTCSTWSLSRFRQKVVGLPDLKQKQVMATLYLERADSPQEAMEGAREGAIPFLRAITQRHALQMGEQIVFEDVVGEGLVQMLLNLADKSRIVTVKTILASSKECGAELEAIEGGKVALACILGSSKPDHSTQEELDKLATVAISQLKAVPSSAGDEEKALSEYIGSASHSNANNHTIPSRMYSFLSGLEARSIHVHLERCRLYLATYHRLATWNNTISIYWLAEAQGQREKQSACVTRIVRTFVRESKNQQQWRQLMNDLVSCVGKQGALDAIEEKDVVRLVAEGALRSSELKVYSFIVAEQGRGQLSEQEQEEIILDASREYYDNAASANLYSGDMKIAYDILSQHGPPTTPRIEQEKAFIEASSRLCSFKIQSALRPGVLLAPIEIRLSHNRLEFIKRLLESREDAYKTPELILELALKLCAVPSGAAGSKTTVEVGFSRPLIENKTLALLTEAALGQGDYIQAQSSCERLVANVTSLGKRVEQSAANQGQQHYQLFDLLTRISEIAYRTCFYLCNQQEWNDHASRLRWCSFVLAYCPDDQVEKYLKTWRQLERQFQEDLLANPPKDWDQVAVQLKPGQGGLTSSLAAIGGLGALESTLSPFSTLFASTGLSALSRKPSQDTHSSRPGSSASMNVKDSNAPPRIGSPSSRAAKLFDSLGGGGGGSGGGSGSLSSNEYSNTGYLDPAERAARAARRFFGGFGA